MDEIKYQPPSDDRETLINQVDEYIDHLMTHRSNPLQAGYSDRLVEFVVKAHEHGWLHDGNSGLTAANLADRLGENLGDKLEDSANSRWFGNLVDTWNDWQVLLSRSFQRGLLELKQRD